MCALKSSEGAQLEQNKNGGQTRKDTLEGPDSRNDNQNDQDGTDFDGTKKYGGDQDSKEEDIKGAGDVEKVYIPEYDGEHLDDSDDDKKMVMAPSLLRIEEAEDADSDSVAVRKS
ncbi:hypothetical protein ABZP36_010106 [Zizania latifolia]